MAVENFYEFNVGHLIELGVFIIAFATLYLDRKKSGKEQVDRHAENQQSLKSLTSFHTEQRALNIKRDDQINELRTQTALLEQLVKTESSRLRVLEERAFRGSKGGD